MWMVRRLEAQLALGGKRGAESQPGSWRGSQPAPLVFSLSSTSSPELPDQNTLARAPRILFKWRGPWQAENIERGELKEGRLLSGVMGGWRARFPHLWGSYSRTSASWFLGPLIGAVADFIWYVSVDVQRWLKRHHSCIKWLTFSPFRPLRISV